MSTLLGHDLLGNPVTIVEKQEITAAEVAEILRTMDSNPVVALVTDNAPIPSKDQLVKTLQGMLSLKVFSNVQPNPRTVDIDAIQDDIGDCNVVIGIGGGSVLDTAKAIAMLLSNGGRIEEYLGNTPKRKIIAPNRPLLLMPTTAGTGSEMTKVGVYTSLSGRKYTLGSPMMHARMAILDPSFLYKAPPKLVASTGADALDHALESIWNKNATDTTRNLAEAAAVEVLSYLPEVYACSSGKKPLDKAAYASMLRASTIAGAAFSITGTAAGHALSFVLSEDWHVPHGSACAFTLLDIFKVSKALPEVAASLARISKHFHPEVIDQTKLVDALERQITDLFETMALPCSFKDLGVALEKKEIDSHFDRSFSDPKMLNQIPKADKSWIYPILESKC